ncbi:3-deoxy-7-phosphoheptulonate synthase [Seleniivibrio woodruffii]|uniref:3-deoxy-D-arabinoheptulosonate-7-phosphate synthase n=1 Tax=Seleniivibrio woodruffii TaxID=1078050 RepID=A0A4R1K7C6_9BACT|nr:3-deoxy-7-phosphoheptulonate synthase [Seleniivibrio woodruffii]TCK59927.1 3-deoxy-D-arabinoheptulosonate-7-phosphate synthase [Seleniivibrio woodruffii]TVZ35852.1 3-deoxy-D-arabinoheptulosonate-7-phosphate synthase [Seleniivibrio woodruffii]
MIVVMKIGAKQEAIARVIETAEEIGFSAHIIEGKERVVVGLVGVDGQRDKMITMGEMDGVDKIIPISKPYKLSSREVKNEPTIVDCCGVLFGGEHIPVIAGPCSVESEEQTIKTAEFVKAAGASMLRGGAFKPRTSPYAFQGLAEEGLKILAKAREVTGLPVVTEVTNPKYVDMVYKYADMFQVGARNIQNFALLTELGKTDKPVLLKRGMSTTIEEFLTASEYILCEGNKNVILCERGLRTFETATRNTLDISAVPVIKAKSHLPIMIDPSHAAGHWQYVGPLSKAAVAIGADGLIIEVHPNPEKAWSDGAQSLTPTQFIELMGSLRSIALAVGRTI